jgi:hypothetical protein
MTQVSVVAPDGGEAIQLGPIQMRILEDGKTTGHRLGVGEITIPPGTAGPPQHRHAQHDEGFYEVSGTARFTVVGGWIGAEMAVRDEAGLISSLVLIDSVGVLVEEQPIRDFFALDARGVAEYSFYDADRFYVDPATVPPEQAAQRAANMATMRVFAGDPYMHDPGLPGRLGRVEIPVLVLWGDSDRIVTPGYGQALAAAFPQAQFTVISQAGHLPQLEQPDATFGALDAFIGKDPGPGSRPAA